jgi:CBS domain-containing protein
MQVSEAMTNDVRIASPNQTIRDAARLMAQIDAGVLPVGENDRLVGMITDRDIAIRAVGARMPKREPRPRLKGGVSGILVDECNVP